MSALLKARSDAAVLRDLKIGPLLGRGSYGRVYRGVCACVFVTTTVARVALALCCWPCLRMSKACSAPLTASVLATPVSRLRACPGRWKATTVAVKIIEHTEGRPGTATSGGKRISVGREALLATSISHPNVVRGSAGRLHDAIHIACPSIGGRSSSAAAAD
jgi:hypothetical protein